ncbi:MAG TPA: hypothetical protein VEY71_04410 [Chitinophagales bacterium]|nr:hypothetical protein [Chitinophagales bacterium]
MGWWRFFIGFVCLHAVAVAQDTLNERRISLTTKPLGLANPILPNATFGIGIQLHERFAVDADFGWIRSWNRNTVIDEPSAVVKNGFKTTLELKYYVNRPVYFSLQGFYNRYNRTREQYVWRYGRAFQQALELDGTLRVYGVHAMAGITFAKPGRRFNYETFGGYGVRYRQTGVANMPPDAEYASLQEPTGGLGNNELIPSMTVGVRVGYKLF